MKEKIIGDSLRASVKPPQYEESLEHKYPDIARNWDYQRNWGLTPRDFKPKQMFRAYWKGERDPKMIEGKVMSYDRSVLRKQSREMGLNIKW